MLDIDPPFGTFSLPRPLERLRTLADGFPENRFGRLAVSVVRKICLVFGGGPFDVPIYPTTFARLYPTTNRCEKRVFSCKQFFDLKERQYLTFALENSPADRPFQFLDLGANVGMYSLWAVAEARRLGRSINVIAVEPDQTTGARLAANIAASVAEKNVKIVPCGVGGAPGKARMIEDETNRGGNHINLVSGGPSSPDIFVVTTIPELCDGHGIECVDAMKIDIEGHDYAALESLFKSGRRDLFPQWIQVEVGRGDKGADLLRLCSGNGYSIAARTKLNAIMQYEPVTGGKRS